MSAAVIKQLRGRPTTYTHEIAAEICHRISLGESLAAICRDPEMPCEKSIYNWLERHADFVQSYVRARELRAERYADEIVDIADSVKGERESAVVHAARLQIDARKWVAAKLLPRQYGDRLDVEGTGNLTVKIVHGLGED
jgi:hypothetical protein